MNFIHHVKTNGKSHEHSLAVNGVSSHGGWDPLRDKVSEPMLITFQSVVIISQRKWATEMW